MCRCRCRCHCRRRRLGGYTPRTLGCACALRSALMISEASGNKSNCQLLVGSGRKDNAYVQQREYARESMTDLHIENSVHSGKRKECGARAEAEQGAAESSAVCFVRKRRTVHVDPVLKRTTTAVGAHPGHVLCMRVGPMGQCRLLSLLPGPCWYVRISKYRRLFASTIALARRSGNQ
jgi:hypothetical protein